MRIFKKKNRIHKMRGDNAMQVISTIVLTLVLLIVGYPVIYVISASFSSGAALSTGKVLLWPVDFTLDGYRFVMQYKDVWVGYKNSILYTIAGVAVTVTLDTFAAFALSRPYFRARKPLTFIFLVTMLFSAGMIPTFIIKSKLGLINSPWAVILAGSFSMHHTIILRTAFSSVPGELYDAAQLDGADHFQTLGFIGLPLIKSSLGVITLYSVVGCWNEYFNSMLYLRDKAKYPLQLILRNLLNSAAELDVTNVTSTDMLQIANSSTDQIRYALIIIATVPVLVVYGLVQKSFKKGVMVGSVKG